MKVVSDRFIRRSGSVVGHGTEAGLTRAQQWDEKPRFSGIGPRGARCGGRTDWRNTMDGLVRRLRGLVRPGLDRCGTEQSGIRIPGDCNLCFEAKVGIRV